MRIAATLTAAVAFLMPTAVAANDWAADIPAKMKTALYPAVLSADWADSSHMGLWLFVIDNGKNRDGLATSACASMQKGRYAPPGTLIVIRVFDAAKASAGVDHPALGKVSCNIE